MNKTQSDASLATKPGSANWCWLCVIRFRKNRRRTINGGGAMLDLIFLAATILFFLLSLAYVRGCEKL
jgi:hypothetical protein